MHPHLIQFEPDENNLAVQRKIKEWAREALKLPPETLITVTERQCPDPACPVAETWLIVHEENGLREFHFSHPKAAITKMHVQQALMPSL